MDDIAWKSHKQAFGEEFSEPRGGGRRSVSEGVVREIPCPLCWEDGFVGMRETTPIGNSSAW